MCEQCTSKSASHEQVTYNGVDIKRALAENPEILNDLLTLSKVVLDAITKGEVDEVDALEAAGAGESISSGIQTAMEYEFESTERRFCPNPLCENSWTAVSDEIDTIGAAAKNTDEEPVKLDEKGFQSANFLSTVITAQEQRFDLTDDDTPAFEQARRLVGSDIRDAKEMGPSEVLKQFQQGYAKWREQVAKPVEKITGGAEETIRDQYYDAPEVQVPLLDETVTIKSSSADRIAEIQTAVEGSDQAARDAIVAMCKELGIDESKIDPQMSPDRFDEVVENGQQESDGSNGPSASPDSSGNVVDMSDQENTHTPQTDGGDNEGVDSETADSEESGDVGDLVEALRDEYDQGNGSGNGGNGGGGAGAEREEDDNKTADFAESDDVGDLVEALRDEYDQGNGADDSGDDGGSSADTGREEDDGEAEDSRGQNNSNDPDGPSMGL